MSEEIVLRWYVIHATSGLENYVMRTIPERAALAGLSEYFGDIIVPTEEVIEIKEGKKRKTERKFFPGYVLVKMHLNDDTWHLVRKIPKVLGFVGTKSDHPTPISDKEADRIMRKVQEGVDKPKPKIMYAPGEQIRIIDGPFADFTGVIEEILYEKNRLKVGVSIFGRSTPVDLEFHQVEKNS
jgi:transcriptional antiterminator NusG